MYRTGEYDIAGFCVGVVERRSIIDGSKIRPGDVVIGLASSGLHSNGYSLVRKVLTAPELKRYSRELLVPTRIYVKEILALLRGSKDKVSGISHITGGAFYDKIARILPGNTDVVISKGSWPIPRIFRFIQEKGNIEDKEIFHTLNMGIGMVLIVRKDASAQITVKLKSLKLRSWVIGEVRKGKGEVRIY
jgi:phosphoribosylformylglycinamidine cyclo-ligase